ncbi:porin [Vibrio tapetis]|uniref:Outer membrane protein U n=2 Tax=Vibrio tapetis TaxID=52443 RepID=A0A2N8ZCE6_9VIBR|nr:porin [Vibrio tapetis]AIY26155.1 outer membrane protein U [Vibrio tapetis]SON49577.1 Outer membrane protein U [Vibrio tapetis subsp. tapetis]
MNKKFIALAIAAAATATGASAAEIAKNDTSSLEMGGRVEARLAIQDGNVEDQSRVRLNFLGKTQITDGLYGLGFYEGEYKATKYVDATDSAASKLASDTLEHRYMYTGIGGNFGEVTMGTVKGSLQTVTDFTDIMAYHGNSAAAKLDVADRPDRSIAYSGEFSGVELRANYAFASATRADNDKNTLAKSDENNGFAASAIYNIGDTGARVTGAFAKQDGLDGTKKVEAQEFMLGASYTISDFYFAGLYTNVNTKKEGVSDEAKVNGYELAAAYTLGQAKFTSTYNRAEMESGSTKETGVDNFAVDASYFFNANFRTYVSYNFNLLKEDKVGKFAAQDQAVLGLRYDF